MFYSIPNEKTISHLFYARPRCNDKQYLTIYRNIRAGSHHNPQSWNLVRRTTVAYVINIFVVAAIIFSFIACRVAPNFGFGQIFGRIWQMPIQLHRVHLLT